MAIDAAFADRIAALEAALQEIIAVQDVESELDDYSRCLDIAYAALRLGEHADA